MRDVGHDPASGVGVPPSSRSAFRLQPHGSLQPRQYHRLRPGQPVNAAF